MVIQKIQVMAIWRPFILHSKVGTVGDNLILGDLCRTILLKNETRWNWKTCLAVCNQYRLQDVNLK